MSERAILRIGCLHGPAGYLFDDIVGLMRRPDGTLLVVDGGSRELRFFNSQGRFIHSVGRRGRGPGEFLSPQLLRSASADSALVFDRRLKRLTILGPEGQVIEVTQPLGLLHGFPVGAVGQHLVTYWTVFVIRDEPGRPYTVPAEYWIYDRTNSTSTQLGKVPGRQAFIVWQSGAKNASIAGPIRTELSVPFDIMPSVAVGQERVYVTAGEGPEVRVYDATGRLRRILRLDEADRPVSQKELDRFIDESVRWFDDPAAVRAVYLRMPRPSVMPAFQSLIVDHEEWLWARVYEARRDVSQSWLVFDTAGVARGTVRTPDGLEIRQIGPDFILGVERDELGVERVALFELDRNGHTPTAGKRSEGQTAGSGPAGTPCRPGFHPTGVERPG